MQLEVVLPSVDLRPDVERVENQAEGGSCQSQACASGLEVLFKRAGKPTNFSAMFLWYFFQRNWGTLGTLSGGDPFQIADILNEAGCCKEPSWPYDLKKVGYKPSPAAYAEARSLFPAGSVAIEGLGASRAAIKRALNNGSPVVFVVNINEDFELKANTKDWRKTAWDDKATYKGQHAVLCIGYDDAAGRYLCQNSWGPNWGDGGFFGVPYEYEKFLAGSTSFVKMPVPIIPLEGYVPYGLPAFDSATAILEMPQMLAMQTALGGLSTNKNVRAKIHDCGTIVRDSSKMLRSECGYVRFQTLSGERHLGLPKVLIDGQLFENVLCINPHVELIHAEAE